MSGTSTADDVEVIAKGAEAAAAAAEDGSGPSVNFDTNTGDLNIQWGDNDFGEKLASQTTSESKAKIESEADRPETLEDAIKDSLEDDKKPDEWGIEDLQMAAEFIIEFLDAVSANLCKWIAKEKDVKQFELSAKKRERLALILAKVLFKYQVKIGPVATLIIAMVLYFGMNFKEAYEIRMIKSAEEEEKLEADNRQKNEKVTQERRAAILRKLKDDELTVSDLSTKLEWDDKMTRKYIKQLVQDDLVIVNDEEPVVKYKAA